MSQIVPAQIAQNTMPAQVAQSEIQPAQAGMVMDTQAATAALVNTESLGTATPTGLNLSIDYWKAEDFQGQEMRFVLLGFIAREVVNAETSESKTLPHAVFADQSRKIWMNAAAKFVDATRRLQVGAMFSATFTKTKATRSGGRMQMFDVFQLVAQ
jgi:hypothetical protein